MEKSADEALKPAIDTRTLARVLILIPPTSKEKEDWNAVHVPYSSTHIHLPRVTTAEHCAGRRSIAAFCEHEKLAPYTKEAETRVIKTD